MASALVSHTLVEMAPVRPLPNYLRTHRKRTALTQREVAFLLGGSHWSKVSRYEQMRRVPTLDTLLGLELVYRAPLSELFKGKHRDVESLVQRRASMLYRQLDELPASILVLRKMDSLSKIIYPSDPDEAA